MRNSKFDWSENNLTVTTHNAAIKQGDSTLQPGFVKQKITCLPMWQTDFKICLPNYNLTGKVNTFNNIYINRIWKKIEDSSNHSISECRRRFFLGIT